MIFKGIQKVSLIDYPHKICAVVFTGGCNFSCHYCHNPELVKDYKELPDITDFQIITFLESRKGFIDALCISGGEPTLHKELPDFIAQVKKVCSEQLILDGIERSRTTEFLVKLDTNGTNPEMLKELFEKKLVDYIAMDIKTTPAKYSKVTDVEVDISKISESIKIIMQSGIDYEFRTTVYPDILSQEDAKEIAEWVKDARFYVLQKPRPDKTLDPAFKQTKLYSDSELLAITRLLPNCIIR